MDRENYLDIPFSLGQLKIWMREENPLRFVFAEEMEMLAEEFSRRVFYQGLSEIVHPKFGHGLFAILDGLRVSTMRFTGGTMIVLLQSEYGTVGFSGPKVPKQKEKVSAEFETTLRKAWEMLEILSQYWERTPPEGRPLFQEYETELQSLAQIVQGRSNDSN